MKKEYSVSDLLPDVVSGFVNAIVSIVFAMAFAAVIFTGSLAEYLPQGIGILLLSSIIFSLLSSILASHPLILSAPQEIPIVVLALMAGTAAANSNVAMSASDLFQFLFVAIGLTSVLVGLFFFLLGWFKLGKIVRFIPLPVIGGFLVGMGWLVIKFALSMMTDLELSFSNIPVFFERETFFRWLPGVIFGIVLFILNRRFKHYLLIPGMLLVGIILFYAVMFAQGISFGSIEDSRYLLGPFPTGDLFPGFAFEYVDTFRWDLYLVFLPIIATMMALSVTEALLNYTALESLVEEDIDLDKELRSTGYSNVIAGVAGAPTGFMRLSHSTISHSIGARSRLSSFIVAVLCTLTLIFGAEALSVFPKLVLGGLLLNVGLVFFGEWLLDTWSKLPRADYLTILFILVVIANMGFLIGVLVGLFLSVIFFIINYSKVKIVKHELTGRTFKSNVERSEQLGQVLEQHDEQIMILSLQGFIFFGCTPQLLKPILNRIDNRHEVPLAFVVFDFRQITGLDSSAINSFKKLNRKARKEDFIIVLCGLSESISQKFINEKLVLDNSETIQVFADLDHGLEWCEEQIIKNNLQTEEYVEPVAIQMSEFSNITGDYSNFLEDQFVTGGTTIIEQGKDPGGIYFIESGEVIVMLNKDDDNQMRLKVMGSGTLVGEVSLYLGTKATATVVTKNDCHIKFLSKENFVKLNQDDPSKASRLHIFIVKLLSDRLAKSNKTMRALLN